MFLKAYNEKPELKFQKNPKFGFECGKFCCYAICDAIYTCFQKIQSLGQKTRIKV